MCAKSAGVPLVSASPSRSILISPGTIPRAVLFRFWLFGLWFFPSLPLSLLNLPPFFSPDRSELVALFSCTPSVTLEFHPIGWIRGPPLAPSASSSASSSSSSSSPSMPPSPLRRRARQQQQQDDQQDGPSSTAEQQQQQRSGVDKPRLNYPVHMEFKPLCGCGKRGAVIRSFEVLISVLRCFFPAGALLAICWSEGQITFLPMYFK